MKILLLFGLICACACDKVVEDKSADSVTSHDLTLISSPCENVPGRGLDICRFTEGSDVSSYWHVLVPHGGKIRGGQIIVQYKDFSKSFSVQEGAPEILIPWSLITGIPGNKWSQDMAGTAVMLALIEYQDDTGVWKTARARGEARILVLAPDYSTMPMDSGSEAYTANMNCRVQYSTAGRSALLCVPVK